MSFDFENILLTVQAMRDQLMDWGGSLCKDCNAAQLDLITNRALWVMAALGLLLFFFSLREVLNWYFRNHRILEEVRCLRSQMMEMQKNLLDLRRSVLADDSLTLLKPDELLKVATNLHRNSGVTSSGSEVARFRLDH